MIKRNNVIYEFDSKWTKKLILSLILSVPHNFSDNKAKGLPLIALKKLFLTESNTKGCYLLDLSEVEAYNDEDLDRMRDRYSCLSKTKYCIAKYSEYKRESHRYDSYTTYGYILGSMYHDMVRGINKNIAKGNFQIMQEFENIQEAEEFFVSSLL